MQSIIMDIISKYGYFGITFLILVENIFPPIPSELILTFGGFLTTKTTLTVMGMTIFSTIGSSLGAVALYGLGRLLSPEKLERFVNSKIGRRLHLKNEDIEKSRKWFLDKGNNTVFFCRFVPIVRSMISIPAGMAGMNFVTFMLLTILGSFMWNLVLITLGALAGNAWMKVTSYAESYSLIVKNILLAAAAVILVRILIKRHCEKRDVKN